MTEKALKNALQELLDGTICQSDLARLQDKLETSESARKLYIESAEIHSFLTQTEQVSNQQANKIVPMERIVRRQQRKIVRIAVMSAAAILIIGLITLQLFLVQNKAPTLTFQTAPGSQFTLSHSSSAEAPEGATLEKGSRLQLSRGTVELTFESGVKSIVMAPADMTLHDHDTLFLNKGTAWFQVPKGAEGFNVKTRELDIVDLGTEFGVFAHANEHDEVHVFKGKVEARALRVRKESTVIFADEARRIDPVGRLTSVKPRINAFLTSLPSELPTYSGSIELSEGRHHLVKGGVSYTVSTSLSEPEKDDKTENGLVMYSSDRISMVFSDAVDLQISSANIPAGPDHTWNSDEDFGTLTLTEGIHPQLHDPNGEIKIDPLSQNAFSWKFSKPNESEFRTPSMQSWRIDLKGIRELVISKDETSLGRAAFVIMVTSPSTQ